MSPAGLDGSELRRGITEPRRGSLAAQFANWLLGCLLIYAFLFGSGYVIFGEWAKGVALLVGGLLAGALILWNLRRTNHRGAET